VVEEVAEGRIAAATDVEIVQEILHRFDAIRQPSFGVAMATNLLDLVPTVFPVTAADIRSTIDIFRQYASQGVVARDALHAAVMKNNGISHILSTDRHFDHIEGIARISVGKLNETRQALEGLTE
jgi:predicted nucleic acid-binding protein